MCLSPVCIDNPYYGIDNIGLNYLHNTYNTKLEVPCGKCPVCISLKQSYFVQRCQCETFDNYLFFGTLTYNRKMIRSLNVNGYNLLYADFKDFQNMIKRIRNDNLIPRGFKYWVVSEYGTSDEGSHRPHFHFLLSVPKLPTDDKYTAFNLEQEYFNLFLSQWKRNIGSKRKPIYEPCCTYINTPKGRTYDFHYVTPFGSDEGEADVAFYVTKYLLKYSDYVDSLHSALKLNLDPDEFSKVWRLLNPRCLCSHNWGNIYSYKVREHIRKGIDYAIKDKDLLYPVFINPINGKTFPLSPYLKKHFFTVSDAHSFYFKQKDDTSLLNHLDEVSSVQGKNILYKKFNEIKKHLNYAESSI